MKTFKSYLKESDNKAIPAIVLGIHDWVHDIGPEHLHEQKQKGLFYTADKQSIWTPSNPKTEYESDHKVIEADPSLLDEIRAHYREHIPGSEVNYDGDLTHPILSRYTSSSSGLNRRLIDIDHLQLDPHDISAHEQAYDKPGNSITTPETTHEFTVGLHNLINNTKEFNKGFVVYSGVGTKMDINAIRQKGHQVMRLPAFTSTSFNSGVAGYFAKQHSDFFNTDTAEPRKHFREMVRIQVPANKRVGVYVGNHSTYPDEEEFILNHGSRLRFIGEPRIIHYGTSKIGQGSPLMIHNAKLLT